MSLVEHAKKELDIIGMTEDSNEEMNREMRNHILHMVEEFSKEGHSGFSAAYTVNALKKLLSYEPLGPLTGQNSEWNDVSEHLNREGVPSVYQNNRCSRVFKEVHADGTVYAYDIDGKIFQEPDGSAFTNQYSKVKIEFPYTPITEYVQVSARDKSQLELNLQ